MKIIRIDEMKFSIATILILISISGTYGQYNGRQFSLAVSGVYTTTAKIFLNPFSSDPVLSNNSFPLEDIYNPSIELRYRVSESIILGLGTEYMISTSKGQNLTVFGGNNTISITVEDGFILVPIELTLYYLMPFSTEDFKFLMGGGVGYYIGSHVREFGDVSVSNESRKKSYGIHVMITMDYMLLENVSIRGEMKFRDPQFTLKSRYKSQDVEYQGIPIVLPQPTFDSKVNVDGVTFMVGAAFHF